MKFLLIFLSLVLLIAKAPAQDTAHTAFKEGPIKVQIMEGEKTWFDSNKTIVFSILSTLLGTGLGFFLNYFKDRIFKSEDRKYQDEKRNDEREYQRLKRKEEMNYQLVKDLSIIKSKADGLVHTLLDKFSEIVWLNFLLKYDSLNEVATKSFKAKIESNKEVYTIKLSEFIELVSTFGGLSGLDGKFARLVPTLRSYTTEYIPAGVPLSPIINERINMEKMLYENYESKFVVKLLSFMEEHIKYLNSKYEKNS